jgi:CBS domain containing-hemolysin-like protein
LDDPFPGSCLAIVGFSWGLSLVLCLSGLASLVFSYIYFLLENFSKSRLLQMANGDSARGRIEHCIAHLPRTVSTVVAIEILSKTTFVLVVYILTSRIYDEELSLAFWPLLWTFLAAGFWFIIFCRVLAAELGSRKEEEVLQRILPGLTRLGAALVFFHGAIGPFQRAIIRFARSSNPEEEAEQITEEIIDAVGEGELEGVIREDEADMIENIMELRDADVSDIMTPRTDMKAVSADASLKDAVRLAMAEGHSRVPVFEKDHDHIIGVLYVKDVMNHWLAGTSESVSLRDIVHKPFFIPETKKISELLFEFREHKIHIAIVLDEYGGTAGLVTNEDIIEEIVGEIVDEYDSDEEVEVRVIGEKTLDVSARAHIGDLNKEWGTAIPESDDFETVGGFIFAELGKVPGKGETVKAGNAELTVTEVGDRSINRVTVRILEVE